MSSLTYNGVQLEVVETLEFSHLPVYDERSNYMFTRVRIIVKAVYNPQATAYKRTDANPAGPTPSGLNDILPASTTEFAVRQALAQGQRQLIYQIDDGNILVYSPPLQGIGVPDCNNGPLVLEAPTVTAVVGSKTMLVRFAVETYINECGVQSPYGDRITDTFHQPLIISHTWERREDIDEDFHSTVTVRGRAVFRTDDLTRLGNDPDDYRGWLFHPLPVGFKRMKISVVASVDGTAINYEFVDRQQDIFLDIYGITRLEGFHKEGYKSVRDWEETIIDINVGGINIVAGVASALAGLGVGSGEGTRQAVHGVHEVLRGIKNMIPRNYHHVKIRAYGVPRAQLQIMSTAVWRFVMARLANVSPGLMTEWEISETRDFVGSDGAKFVEVDCFLVGGVLNSFITTLNASTLIQDTLGSFSPATAIVAGLSLSNPLTLTTAALTTLAQTFSRTAVTNNWSKFPTEQPFRVIGQIPGVPLLSNLLSDWQNTSAQPGFANGTRGDYLAHLAAQELTTPCSPTQRPTSIGRYFEDIDPLTGATAEELPYSSHLPVGPNG